MTTDSQRPTERQIFTVSELNRAARVLLETHFPMIWLVGEVSNLATPASGHKYFSLKDAAAQIRCALFKNRVRATQPELANGQQVSVRARLSLYEPRGDYQLIVEHIEAAGEGALRPNKYSPNARSIAVIGNGAGFF